MDPILIGRIMLAALMLFGVVGFLLLGFPVAFTLAGTCYLFCGVGMALGVSTRRNFGSFCRNRISAFMTNGKSSSPCPSFIFMGVMAWNVAIRSPTAVAPRMARCSAICGGGLVSLCVAWSGAMLAAIYLGLWGRRGEHGG